MDKDGWFYLVDRKKDVIIAARYVEELPKTTTDKFLRKQLRDKAQQ